MMMFFTSYTRLFSLYVKSTRSCDSSLVFGRGHLSRTKNVVTQLQHLGHSVTFAPSPPFDEYNNDLSFESFCL